MIRSNKSLTAAISMEKIDSGLKGIGSIKEPLIKVKKLFFKISNSSTQRYGTVISNSSIAYYPLLVVMTDDEMQKFTEHMYGSKSLGKCNFYYFIKVKGKMIPSLSITFSNCVARYMSEINYGVLNKIKFGEINEAFKADHNSPYPKNFQQYMNKISIDDSMDTMDSNNYEEEYGFTPDQSRYITCLISYDALEFKSTTINISGVEQGKNVSKIDCYKD